MEKCKFLQILACSTGIKKSVKFTSSVRDCLGKFCIPTLQVYRQRERGPEVLGAMNAWPPRGGVGGSGSGPRNSPTCQPPPLPPPLAYHFPIHLKQRGGGKRGVGGGETQQEALGMVGWFYWLGWVNMYQIFIFRFNLHPKVLKQANFRGSSQKSLADIK